MQGAQFHTPPMTKVNKMIIITIAVLFVLNTILTQTSWGYHLYLLWPYL
jgi:ABC-type uncharacterized transport system permease subunit